jgi:hypothetical protein
MKFHVGYPHNCRRRCEQRYRSMTRMARCVNLRSQPLMVLQQEAVKEPMQLVDEAGHLPEDPP